MSWTASSQAELTRRLSYSALDTTKHFPRVLLGGFRSSPACQRPKSRLKGGDMKHTHRQIGQRVQAAAASHTRTPGSLAAEPAAAPPRPRRNATAGRRPRRSPHEPRCPGVPPPAVPPVRSPPVRTSDVLIAAPPRVVFHMTVTRLRFSGVTPVCAVRRPGDAALGRTSYARPCRSLTEPWWSAIKDRMARWPSLTSVIART